MKSCFCRDLILCNQNFFNADNDVVVGKMMGVHPACRAFIDFARSFISYFFLKFKSCLFVAIFLFVPSVSHSEVYADQTIESYVDSMLSGEDVALHKGAYMRKWKEKIDVKVVWPGCETAVGRVISKIKAAGIDIDISDVSDGHMANFSVVMTDDVDDYFSRNDVRKLISALGFSDSYVASIVGKMKKSGYHNVMTQSDLKYIFFSFAVINGKWHPVQECGEIVSKILFEEVSGFMPCCGVPHSIEGGGGELTDLDLAFLASVYRENGEVLSKVARDGIVWRMKKFLHGER